MGELLLANPDLANALGYDVVHPEEISNCEEISKAENAERAERRRVLLAEYKESNESHPAKATDTPNAADHSGSSLQQQTADGDHARSADIAAYKSEGKVLGIRISDAMIAKAANRAWNDRTQVTWWKANDPRSTAAADSAIRRVLREKPHLSLASQK